METADGAAECVLTIGDDGRSRPLDLATRIEGRPLRLVGFEAAIEPEQGPAVLVDDFRLHGGQNLFAAAGPEAARRYRRPQGNAQLVGLRAYPAIRPPNFAAVTSWAQGEPGATTTVRFFAVVQALPKTRGTYGG